MERNEQPTAGSESQFEIPEGIRRARAAFLRDFSRLIADRRYRGKYVCYHNDTLVAVNKDYFALIAEAVALIAEAVGKQIPEDGYMAFHVIPGEDRAQQLIADEAEIDPDYQ